MWLLGCHKIRTYDVDRGLGVIASFKLKFILMWCDIGITQILDLDGFDLLALSSFVTIFVLFLFLFGLFILTSLALTLDLAGNLCRFFIVCATNLAV